jgi:hypothetical protein
MSLVSRCVYDIGAVGHLEAAEVVFHEEHQSALAF